MKAVPRPGTTTTKWYASAICAITVNTRLKRFMGMPTPGSDGTEKIQLWVGIIIGIALIVLAMYLVGCKGECIRECRSTMEACQKGPNDEL